MRISLSRLVMLTAIAGGIMQAAETTLALDSAAPNKITAHLTLTTPSKLTLEFSSSQEIDAVIVNSDGKEVQSWSAGRMFAQMMHSVEVDGSKQWPLTLSPSPVLPPGKYVLKMWLTTIGAAPKPYSGSVPFEIAR